MTSSAGVRLEKDIWRTIVICPNCGEDNAPNFRFCGMCGTLLEARRPAGVPAPNPVSAGPPASPPTLPSKTTNAPEPVRPVAVESAPRTPSKPLPPISGPSILGLDQPSANQPSLDSLREEPFSGLDSFFERKQPEQPTTGGRRILLLVLLLAALGGAGWWTYTKYLGAMENRKPETAASSASEAPAEKPTSKPATQDAAPAPDANSSQTVAPSAGVPPVAPSAGAPEGPSENTAAAPEATPKTADAETKSAAEAKPVAPKKALPEKRAEKRKPRMTAKRSQSPPPTAGDTGDADFRKGEAYLYGRGAPKNCDQAVKYLKTASAQSNAKARSTFGTMYATGHCVPRDLPTSYLWFALALRADPNNQTLEKDLSAIWNQMTPPERQLATRMKQ